MIAISNTAAAILGYLSACRQQDYAPNRTDIVAATDVAYSSVSHALYRLMELELVERDLEAPNGAYRYRLIGVLPDCVIVYHHSTPPPPEPAEPVRTMAQARRYGY